MSFQAAPDICFVDGVSYSLHAFPLEPMLDRLAVTPLFAEVLYSNCYRGYIAEWCLLDESLYLCGVYSPDGARQRIDFESSNSSRINDELERVRNVSELAISGSDRLPPSADTLRALRAWLHGDRGKALKADWVRDIQALRSLLALPGDHPSGSMWGGEVTSWR